MKKIITSIAIILAGSFAFGQYYYLTDSGNTPGGLNQDPAYPVGGGQVAGWTSILGPSVATPTWSASQTIPFAFNFNGAPVTSFVVSSTGVLTFTASPGAAPSATPAALPSPSIPDNSICVWGLNASGTNDNVSVKTFGTAPNRQRWIHFSSCVNGSIAWSYYAIVLEETTNKIYVVDQRNTTGNGALSIGIQIDNGTAYSVTGSPSVGAQAGTDPTSADDVFYEFIYGTQPANEIALMSVDVLPYVAAGNNTIMGTIRNLGSSPITSFTAAWNTGSGPQSAVINGVNVAPNGTYYQFSHPTQLNAVAAQSYTIDMGVTMTGDVDLMNNSASASTVTLTQIPAKTTVGEEKTGTWCQWCPRGAVGLAGMEATPSFIGIAVHNGDPMTVASYDGSIGTYVPGGYPGGGVDRVLEGDPSTFSTMHANRVTAVVPCAVNSVNASYNATTDAIDVSAVAEFYGTISGNYRMSLIITENDVIGSGSTWNQVNAYNGGANGLLTDPVTGFEWSTAGSPVNPTAFGGYDHVARYLSSDNILGDAGSLPAGSVPLGTHNHTFTSVPASTVNSLLKTHAVVLILNATTGEILNAKSVSIANAPGASVNEIDYVSDYVLFPNPSNGNVNLSFNLLNSANVSVQITDMLGNLVHDGGTNYMTAGEHKATFTGNNLTDGIYFVNLTVDGQTVTKRWNVVR